MRDLFQGPVIREGKANLVRRDSESQNDCPCCCRSYGTVCFSSQILAQPGCCGRNSDSPSFQWSVRGSGVTSFLLSPAVCCQCPLYLKPKLLAECRASLGSAQQTNCVVDHRQIGTDGVPP